MKKSAFEQRNLAARDNRQKARQRLRETVAANESDGLAISLSKHKPATNFALALRQFGTKPSSLPNARKATVIDAIVHLHSKKFTSADDPPTFESTASYDEDEEINSEIEVEEV